MATSLLCVACLPSKRNRPSANLFKVPATHTMSFWWLCVFSKDAQAAATAASSSAAQPAATVAQPAEATKPMPPQEHGLERRAAAAAAEEGAATMIGPTLPPEPPRLGLILQQKEAARAAEAAAAIPESPPSSVEQPVVCAVMTLTADPLPIVGDDGKVVWQNEGLPQNDSGDLPPKRLRCALIADPSRG